MASWPMVYNSLPGYAGFTSFTPTIPKLYWDVYSQEERIKRICMELHKLCEYASALNVNINLNHEMIDALQAEFEKFKESGFIDYYEAQLEEWINANMPEIIGKYIRMVFFGINLDGYFVAYIPEGSAWDDIVFDTGANYDLADYGRLILRYEVDAPNNVQQREPFEADFGDLWDIVASMTREMQRIDTNMDSCNDSISSVETTQEQQQGDIDNIESNLTTITNNIDDINENIADVNNDMETISNTQMQQATDITTLNNTVFTALRSDE